MNNQIEFSEQAVWDLLSSIPDPEVPAISIVDLGVVRNVHIENNKVEVSITPTYTGCPALKMIEEDIIEKLQAEGLEVKVKTVFKPAWTTDWMSDETKQKLKDYGITPPAELSFEHLLPLGNTEKLAVACAFCDSTDTTLTSQFGSTACKALYFCNSCHQPFEHFKCH